MSKVSIELDLSVVQEAIHARVQPAVDAILSKYDLTKLIEKELKKPTPVGRDRYFMSIFGSGETVPLVDHLVTTEIRSAAEAFVKGAVANQKDRIERALRKMMADSESTLANTLVASLEQALEANWQFRMETTVTPKEPERDRGDD